MKKLIHNFLFLVPMALVACPPNPVPPPNPPPDTDLCGAMCDHLLKLGCDEGRSVYDNDLPGPPDVPNQTCEANCIDLQKKGFFVNTRCVATVTQCSQIEDYRQKDLKNCGVSK